MPSRSTTDQIAFRYKAADSATGSVRNTAKRLAERLGVDETQAVHLALDDMEVKLVLKYNANEGPLTAAEIRLLKTQASQANKESVCSSVVELAAA